jgi:hypothetical protein
MHSPSGGYQYSPPPQQHMQQHHPPHPQQQHYYQQQQQQQQGNGSPYQPSPQHGYTQHYQPPPTPPPAPRMLMRERERERARESENERLTQSSTTALLQMPIVIISIQNMFSDLAPIHPSPCEIGISVGYITEGEIASFHCLIDPEPIPTRFETRPFQYPVVRIRQVTHLLLQCAWSVTWHQSCGNINTYTVWPHRPL